MNLYQEELLDHYRNPRLRRPIAKADFCVSNHNPSCGDSIVVEARVLQEALAEVGFEGSGCVISQAAASMVAERLIGVPLAQIGTLGTPFVTSIIKLPLGPTRMQCALLFLQALQQGIASYQARDTQAPC